MNTIYWKNFKFCLNGYIKSPPFLLWAVGFNSVSQFPTKINFQDTEIRNWDFQNLKLFLKYFQYSLYSLFINMNHLKNWSIRQRYQV